MPCPNRSHCPSAPRGALSSEQGRRDTVYSHSHSTLSPPAVNVSCGGVGSTPHNGQPFYDPPEHAIGLQASCGAKLGLRTQLVASGAVLAGIKPEVLVCNCRTILE